MHKYQLDSSSLDQSQPHVPRREAMNISENKDHHKEEEKPQILPQKREREDGDDDQSFAHMLGDDGLTFVHMTDSYAQVEVPSPGVSPNQHQNHALIGKSNSALMTEYLREILTGKKPQIEDNDDDLSFVRMFDSYNVQVKVHSPGLLPNQHQYHGSIGTSNSVPMTEYLREILTGKKPRIEDNDDLTFARMLDSYNVQVEVHSPGLAPNQHQNHGSISTSNSVLMTEYLREILTGKKSRIEDNEDDLSFVSMLDSYDVQVEVHSPGLGPNQHQNNGLLGTSNSVPMTEYLQELVTEEKPLIEDNDDDPSFVPLLDSYNLLAEVHSPSLAPNQQHGAIDTKISVLMTEYLQEISRVKKPQIEDDDDLSFVCMLESYNAQVEVHSSGETIADHTKQENCTLTTPDTTEPLVENYSSPLRIIDEYLNSSTIEEEEEEGNASGKKWQDYGLIDIISCPAVEEPASLEPLASVSQNEDDPRVSMTMEELLKLSSTEAEEDFPLLHKPAQEESGFLLLQDPVEVEALPHEEKHEPRDVVAEFSIKEWTREMEDQNWIEETIPE